MKIYYICFVITIICLYLTVSAKAQNINCQYPSLEDLKNTEGTFTYIIRGKVLTIRRMPPYEQRPLKQFIADSWEFYPYKAKIRVTELIKKFGTLVFPNEPKTNRNIINLALEESISPGYNHLPFRLFTLKRPNINYIEKGKEYIFFIVDHTGYRNGFFDLYAQFNEKVECNNFYIYPMLIEDGTIEVPVQYYGSNEIIRKKFKYKDIVNLYKEVERSRDSHPLFDSHKPCLREVLPKHGFDEQRLEHGFSTPRSSSHFSITQEFGTLSKSENISIPSCCLCNPVVWQGRPRETHLVLASLRSRCVTRLG